MNVVLIYPLEKENLQPSIYNLLITFKNASCWSASRKQHDINQRQDINELRFLFSESNFEFLKKQYQIFKIQISIYFLALFSFLIIHLPTVTGIINYWIFLLSGVFALIIIAIYLFCLLYTSPSPRDLSTSRMPSSA